MQPKKREEGLSTGQITVYENGIIFIADRSLTHN